MQMWARDVDQKPDKSNSAFLSRELKPWRVIALLAVFFVVFLLLALPAHNGGEPSHQDRCRVNLGIIDQALKQYHDEYGSLPPVATYDRQGRPLHSWRALLLAFKGAKDDEFPKIDLDEPWDSKHNTRYAEWLQLPFYYGCPDDTADREDGVREQTSYLAVVGENTAWPAGSSLELRDITDDPSTTILLVEVADSGTHWMEPRDLVFREMDLTVNGRPRNSVSSRHDNGANVLFVDGKTGFLRDDTPPEVLRAMLTVNGGEQIKQDWLGRYSIRRGSE